MLSSLVNASMVLGSIDDRLMQCGVSWRSFLKFCSALMVAASFGLAITDKLTPEGVAEELGKVIRPPVIWLHFQDCTGCTETLLRSSHPDLGDLILNARFVAFAPEADADHTLEVLRSYSFASNAVRAGTVYSSPSKVVTLRTQVGGNRVLDMLSGEQLPRIC